ncbi:hypothetical protein CEXT_391891 [Caerostris extrusa]|uniref:Uncharacterized protein n=1 Tax=Caerostris extrusa TaxID=172846 RepID=A0AAV4WAS7_CAEEX|nr:hypothetical protein CEXT_391891 [Caerostris extrusa]
MLTCVKLENTDSKNSVTLHERLNIKCNRLLEYSHLRKQKCVLAINTTLRPVYREVEINHVDSMGTMVEGAVPRGLQAERTLLLCENVPHPITTHQVLTKTRRKCLFPSLFLLPRKLIFRNRLDPAEKCLVPWVSRCF